VLLAHVFFWKPTLIACVLLVSCGTHRPLAEIPIAAPPPDAPQETGKPATANPPESTPPAAPFPSPAPPAKAAEPPKTFRTSINGISISGVAFDSRTHRLMVADQDGGPGSRWGDASDAAKALNGIAAINGGFFTPEGKPLGLVIAGGKRSGSLNKASSLGAGIYTGGNSPSLLRRERPSNAAEVLQSGPFLIERGQAVGGLSSKSSTARSFIAWDGRSGWIIARTGACSLADLSAALAKGGISGLQPATALNLDGGRSSDLWISSSLQGGPLHERPLWNKTVRNFLVLVPRS